MTAVKFIAIWGIIAIVAAVLGGILAAAKRRDHSRWAAWCFIFPPAIFILLATPRNMGPRPRRPTLEEEDEALSRD